MTIFRLALQKQFLLNRRKKHRTIPVLFRLLVMILSVGATPLDAAEELSKSEEGQIYDQAIHILGGNANVISKWMDDIRFVIIGQASENSVDLARTTLADIAEQTRLPLRPIEHSFDNPLDYLEALKQSQHYQLSACSTEDPEHCANFVILFTDANTMHALTTAIPLRSVYQKSLISGQSIPCFFAPFVSRDMVIRQAVVYVNKNLSQAMVKTCLQEEIYQSFGLFNDFSDSRFFSFNNVVEPKNITRYDKALLSSVYDDQIKPGAPVWRVMERLMDRLGIDPFVK